MASITLPAQSEARHPNIRPLSVLRDLPSVADLIEQCFSTTMDSDGKRYVQDMRRAGSDNSFLQWAKRAADSTTLPLTGYVWEEDHRVIGNVSLIPFSYNKRRLYLIANVATHPDYRRRGIARALTQRAIQHSREREDRPHLAQRPQRQPGCHSPIRKPRVYRTRPAHQLASRHRPAPGDVKRHIAGPRTG